MSLRAGVYAGGARASGRTRGEEAGGAVCSAPARPAACVRAAGVDVLLDGAPVVMWAPEGAVVQECWRGATPVCVSTGGAARDDEIPGRTSSAAPACGGAMARSARTPRAVRKARGMGVVLRGVGNVRRARDNGPRGHEPLAGCPLRRIPRARPFARARPLVSSQLPRGSTHACRPCVPVHRAIQPRLARRSSTDSPDPGFRGSR